MKPANRTITYTVYEPDYVPGMRYEKARSLKEAKTWCRRFGIGSEIIRNFSKRNRKNAGSMFSDFRPWIYYGEHPKQILLFQQKVFSFRIK